MISFLHTGQFSVRNTAPFRLSLPCSNSLQSHNVWSTVCSPLLQQHIRLSRTAVMNNALRCLSKAQCSYEVSRNSVSYTRRRKRFAQTHTGHGQLVCLKNREENGNMRWISGKLVLRMRNGSNWRAVVLSDTVLYCIVRSFTFFFKLIYYT